MKKKIWGSLVALLSLFSLQSISLQAEFPCPEENSGTNKVQERILWGAPISPYVRTDLVTFYEKKVPFTHNNTLPAKLLTATHQPIDKNFEAASPFGKIPAYEEIDANKKRFTLSESAVIADYINQISQENPLRPTCPKANAQVSFFIGYAGSTLAPATHAILFENVVKPAVLKEKTDEARVKTVLQNELPPILDFLEKSLSDGRSWIADTQNFSLADIVIGSHLATLDTAKLSAMEQIGTRRPHLSAYLKKVLERDSFKKALKPLAE